MLVVVKNGDEYTSYTLHSIELDGEKGLSFFCRDPSDRWVTLRPPQMGRDVIVEYRSEEKSGR